MEQERISELEDEVKELKDQLDEKGTKIGDLENELEEMKEGNEEKDNIISDLDTAAENIVTQLKDTLTELEDISSGLSKLV